MDLDKVALQMYTVREPASQDFPGTLRQVAEMGYRAVEFAGYGGMLVGQLRSLLDELGLKAVSSHVPLTDCLNEPDRVIEELHALGCEYAVVPWAPENTRDTIEHVHELGRGLNAFGERAKAQGIRFGYHNHSAEFAKLDGVTVYDILAAATDHALVHLELDVYWAKAAGADPISLINKYSGRMPLLHLKDMSGDSEPHDLPVGEGIIDWTTVISAGKNSGSEWYIVEQDNPRDPLEDVRTSLRNLEKIG